MYPLGWERDFAKDRIAEAHAEAEVRGLLRGAAGRGPTLRARVARKLFQAAVALEHEEAWRSVWDKLEAPKHP